MNHFEFFGLPASFELDLKLLDERYRGLSQQWHPDKFTGEGPKERLHALETTARLNEGYKILRDPVLRSAYLLKALGVDLDDEGERTFQMDPKFLMEMLDLRELLDDAKRKGDLQSALKMGREMATRQANALEQLKSLFAEQQASPDAGRLARLANQVAALRYYRRFQDEVGAIEEASLGQ